MNLSSWLTPSAEEGPEGLLAVLKRVYSILPFSEPAQSTFTNPTHLLTHLLHLSSTGYILPHVDNIEASAGTIIGISLGAERTLLLERDADSIEVRLSSGSVYLQRYEICLPSWSCS